MEHVGLGSDFDGATTPPFDVNGLHLITRSLRKAQFSEHDIALIMGGNGVRVLSQNLPDRSARLVSYAANCPSAFCSDASSPTFAQPFERSI